MIKHILLYPLIWNLVIPDRHKRETQKRYDPNIAPPFIFPNFVLVIYQTRAIVLRTVKYGETSLIVDMYTEQKGLQTFMVNSVRKAKASTPPSYLQLLSLVDIVAYYREQKDINHIREVRLEYPYKSIPFDPRKSAVALFLAELCSKCLKTTYPQADLFEYLHEVLIRYDKPETFDRDFLQRFLIEFSSYLGFGFQIPDPDEAGKYFDLQEGRLVPVKPYHDYLMTREDLHYLSTILTAGEENRADVPAEIRRRLMDLLVLYYQLHSEGLREIRSLKILRELF
jgi:DNA repair protein RecO (recombination protein O)